MLSGLNSRDPPAAAPFIGRSQEMKELIASFTKVTLGEGQIFLIGGEPGIGKTRIAVETCAAARSRGMRTSWGRCWSGSDAPAYWPWIEALRGCIPGGPGEAETGLMAIVRTAEADGRGLRANMIPGAWPSSEESDLRRFALFELITRLLRSITQAGPLVIVLDDLHLADEASLQLLRFVSHRLRGISILLLITYRDVEVRAAPRLGDLFQEISREATTITLQGLTRKDIAEFVVANTGRTLDKPMLLRLHRRTGGNPFFLGETLRLLAGEKNQIGASVQSIGNLQIPDTVRVTIRRRLDLLSDELKEVLRSAAVVGVDFEIGVLQRVTGIEHKQLADLLAAGIYARILDEEPGARGCYRFAHSLTAETICCDLTPAERATLHRKIASAMEDLYGAKPGSHLAEIAHHWAEADAPERSEATVEYLRQAARSAMESLAYEESARLLQTAIEIAPRDGGKSQEQKYELLMELGESLFGSGLISQARFAFEQAGEIAHGREDSQRMARAALGRATTPTESEGDAKLVAMLEEALALSSARDDPGTRAKLLARLGSELQWSDDKQAAAVAAEAAEFAERSGDPITRIHVFYWGLRATWSVDNLEERISALNRAVEIAETIGSKLWSLKTRHLRFLNLLEKGEIHRADLDFARFSELTDELRLPFGWKEMASAERALFDGRLDDAERFSLMALEIGRRMERRFRIIRQAFNNLSLILRREQGRIGEIEPLYRSAAARNPADLFVQSALAFCNAELGQRSKASQAFEYVVASGLESIPRKVLWYALMVLLSETCVFLGDTQRAELLYRLMTPFAERNALLDIHVCYGPMEMYLGSLAALMSRWNEAERHFRNAMASNQRMGSHLWLARTKLYYASMLLRRDTGDDRSRALEQLQGAIEIASAQGMEAIKQKALALRERLGAPHPGEPVPSPPPVKVQAATHAFKKEGEIWTIAAEGKSIRLKDAKGFGYIARLLRYPGQEFHALDLIMPGTSGESLAESEAGTEDEVTARELRREYGADRLGDAGEMLDKQAKAAYARRIAELQDELEEAREFKDERRIEKAENEIDALTAELSRAVGLSGRDRRAASAAERARVNVTRSIRSVIHRISAQNKELAAMLEKEIRTGTFCSYNPAPKNANLRWEL